MAPKIKIQGKNFNTKIILPQYFGCSKTSCNNFLPMHAFSPAKSLVYATWFRKILAN